MKKVLLGSTALFAAAALASPAVAADKIKLGLGGYFAGAAAYVDTGDLAGDNRDYTFGSDSEVHFKGETTLDNGIKVGFKAELELERDCKASGIIGSQGTCSADTIDEVYIYVSGGFGKIEFGQQDGVGEQMYFGAPQVFQRVLLTDADLSPTEKVIANEIDVFTEESDDFTKINYFTPRISGFQVGVSFTPEADRNSQDFNAFSQSGGDEIFEAGINFDNKWNDVGIQLSATYLTARDDGVTGHDSPDMYALGAKISYAGFTIGGGYSEKDGLESGLRGSQDPGTTTETTNYEIGVTYDVGPWTFGVGYANEDLTASTAADTQENSKILGGVAYKLGPGINLGLGVEFNEQDFALSSVTDHDTTAVFTEFAISF